MVHRTRLLVSLSLLLLLFCNLLEAEPDDTQQAWMERIDMPAHWDNVQGSPDLVAGPKPVFRFARRLHTFRLAPEERITVRVAAGQRARLYRPEGLIESGRFEFSWSNGTGLFAVIESVPTADGRSLLVAPGGDGDTLVRVERKDSTGDPLELALFVSRDANSLTSTSYREAVKPTGSRSPVRLHDGFNGYDYWRAEAAKPLRFELRGAARIRIDSRLLFPDQGGPFADSYRIFAYLDGAPWRVFDLATLLDTSAAVSLDGCNAPVGRKADAYLDVPDGRHWLELRVRRPLLLRLLARQEPADYLYAGNRPLAYQATVGGSGSKADSPFFWGRTAAELSSLRGRLARPDSLTYLDTVRVAQDNGHRQGGAAALRPLSGWTRRYTGEAQYRTLAARREILHTFYRDMLPLWGAGEDDSLFAWFTTPRLQQHARPVVVPERYVGGLTDNLAGGFFSKIPGASARPREFLIPEQARPSQLRIVVDRAGLGASQDLYLQMDNAPAVRLRMDKHRLLPADAFRPNTGAIGLAMLKDRGEAGAATLSGAFAARHAAAPLADVSYIELPLETAVRRVRMWRAEEGSLPLRAALAYRTSGWYRMSEMGYLGLLQEAGVNEVLQLLQKNLREIASATAVSAVGAPDAGVTTRQQDTAADLVNQWLPLLRFLRVRYAQFASVVEPQGPGSRVSRPAGRPDIEARVERALLAERSGDWQSALEHWSWIERRAHDSERLQARSGQINALQALGNLYLAKQLLRYDLLYAGQPAAKKAAMQTLVALAEQEGDQEGLLALRVVWAVLDPQPMALNDLVTSLLATGRPRYAMQALLALPEDLRSRSNLLEAAYTLGWWQLFEATLAGSDDRGLKALWQGYRAQLQGAYTAALEHWRGAGRNGDVLARRLIEGQRIRAQFDSSDPDVRGEALLGWETWQLNAQGPRVWRDVPQSVRRHGGVKTLLAVDQEELSSHFRATPATPVTLAVYGPTSLRFDIRPLHAADNGEAINDWVELRTGSGIQRFPVTDNQVSPGLRLAGERRPLPGRRVEIRYQVPRGYHTLQLRSRGHDILVAVSALRSRIPLTVLPPLDPHTVRGMLSAGGRDTPQVSTAPTDRETTSVQVVARCGDRRTLGVPLFAATANPGAELRLAGSDIPAGGRRKVLEANRSIHGQSGYPVRNPRPEQVPTGQAAVEDRLIDLLWALEERPEDYDALLLEAENHARSLPPDGRRESILRRLRRDATWELVRSVQQSAGVRLVEFSGWHPETPAMRTRKAVMELDSTDEQILSGPDARVLSMHNLAPVELRLQLTMEDLVHLPGETMRVLVTQDDMPGREILLDAGKREAILVEKIGAGNHHLRIRIVRPLANQFLRVKISERRGRASWTVSEPVQRTYTVATPDQPLVLLLQGPTQLRIDEWREGVTVTDYRSVPAGWQEVVIPVAEGREEALLRVFRRTRRTLDLTTSVRTTRRPVTRIADPLWDSDPAAGARDVSAADALPLGGQEDGTWLLSAGLVNRRNVDDEPLSDAEEERFLPMGASYHYFSAARETYYEAGALVRLREQGDPTLAIHGSLGTRKLNWPMDLDIAGSLFLQNLDSSGRTEFSSILSARLSRVWRLSAKSSHRPSLSLFQRWLSLDEIPPGERGAVDQDIFTRYKSDHRQGLRIGDRISYRPWLDTVMVAGAHLVSNDDFDLRDPDKLSLNVGARQLIGDLSLGMDYRWLHYFKDDDRDKSSDTRRLRIDLGFSRWLNPRHGLQARLRYEYDQESADASIFLSFSLGLSNGRYYRDFKPNDLDFLSLRQRRALERRALTEPE